MTAMFDGTDLDDVGDQLDHPATADDHDDLGADVFASDATVAQSDPRTTDTSDSPPADNHAMSGWADAHGGPGADLRGPDVKDVILDFKAQRE